ncbi:hypothetical protein P170DRAFT_363022 [Aspergillus steynii IBT 23096]|uniref:Rhodopsin domain-containing protein n=1 Tax=Aspergillus steynii IBT 23096 TaxID=1392250 RepID=A0A2I2G2V2_9EURO|nr:uncharacterized protein P170DRAFT_363022 [Aspergillus steynii IBT 23096]PLB47213.1 hypothetical protein P170DRAFT_363022 [Aspergillus steynii IBT 23096]
MDDFHNSLIPRSEGDGAGRGQRALVVTGILTGIAAVTVAMRFLARVGLMKTTGREDWTILLSLAFSIVYLGLVASGNIETHYGLGRHSNELSPHDFQQQLKRLWAAIPMYNASLACTKYSILFQYLRIFPDRGFRITCYIVMAIVAIYSSWAIVSGYVNCVPVARFWNREIPGSCLSFEALWFFNASMNIATDLALLIMPMPLLSHLQLPRMQKLALMAVFAIGGLVAITSILRLSSLRTVSKSPDTSYSNVAAAYWTAAECNVAIICACLPFLRPLVSRLFPKLLSTNSYNRYSHSRGLTLATNTNAKSKARRSQVPKVPLYSQDREFGLCTVDVEVQAGLGGEGGGIEVRTEMTQQSSVQGEESTSQRRLVMDV